MKILIAGLGSIGRRHLRNLLALGESDILLYRTHQSTLPDEDLTGLRVETNLQAALEWSPQAVIISNPTALHFDVAIPAAWSGCHLLIEKPLSNSMGRVSELQAAIEAGGRQILVGYHLRFHPGLQRIANLLEEDAIGRPVSIRAHWGEYLPDWHPWEDYRRSYSARRDLGGGVLLTLSHPLDYIRWLMGEVEGIWAIAGQLSDLEMDVEDTAEIGLQFANGAIGSIHLNYLQRPTRHHLEITGTHGTLLWDNAGGATRLFIPETDSWEVFPVPDGFERNDLFQSEMAHFLAVARGEAPPVCTLEDGIRALQLALAAKQSSREGQVVRLRALKKPPAGGQS